MMKKTLVTALSLLVIATGFWLNQDKPQNKKEEFAEYLASHPYNQREPLSEEQIKALPKKDRPDLANEREFLLTMDPALKRPAPERLFPVIKEINELRHNLNQKSLPGSVGYEWNERGPDNVGGRTRAFMFDPNDNTNKKVWAGGVGGGLWYNNDITNASSQWQSVDDFWVNIAISCIAFDPNNTNVFYVGTGEGWFNIDAQRGGGLWKTTDGGTTWSQLSATTSSTYRYIQDVLVHPVTSDVYVATNNGLRRSTDGGSSFSQVLTGFIADLEIGSDNMLYAATGNVFTTGNIYRSSNGAVATWSSINGNGFPSSGIGRIEIAPAPNNSNVLYAMTQGLSTYDVEGIYRSNDQGNNWTALNLPVWDNGGNFARGQAWYNLIIGVDPTNENTVYVGAIDLFKSTNGGSNWTQISKWDIDPTNSGYVHADQHNITFKPDDNNFVVFSNDGGMSISTNGGSTMSTRVNGYNVTQFYSCAIDPGAGSPNIVGGTQDNGTHYISSAGIASSVEIFGGDGAFAFIDQQDDDIIIVSIARGNFYKYQNGSYAGQIIGGSTGSFINPADYDDRENILFTAIDNSTASINRIINIEGSPSVQTLSTSINAEVTHLRVSPYASNGTSNLYVGTASGGVYKITNAHNASASTSNISVPGTGSVSCIEIGADENELLVTLSNYGVTSVYYSSNGGSSWTSKEGDLPDMPVRWALFNPNNRNEVILATELGVWGTNDIASGSVDWEPHVLGMANARVDMMEYRESDKEVVAGTHGRGFFTSSGFNENATPDIVAEFSANITSITAGQSVTFTDESTGNPETWAWTFNNGTPNSFNGQNPPAITYNNAGCFEVSLTVTRASGSETDTETKTCYINVTEPQICEELFSYDVDNNYVVNEDDAAVFALQFIDEDQRTPDPNLASNGWTSEWATVTISGNDAIGAVSWFDPPGQASNWFIFGPLTLPDLSATLSWKHAMPDNNFRDGYDVIITTTGGAIANFSDPEATIIQSFDDNDAATNNHTDLTDQSVSIPANYLENQVYIAFHHNADDMVALYLDDFVVDGCQSVEVPDADFEADVTTIPQGGTVDFTDLTTGTPTSWLWDFDGGIGATTVQNPSDVQFNNAGCHEIKLVASNMLGTDSITKTCYINVIGIPVADFVADSVNILTGESVDFTDLSTNNPDAWDWTFNGAANSSSTLQNPSDIVYNNKGCFPVTLVASAQGFDSSPKQKTCYINVFDAPTPDFEADNTIIPVGTTVNFTDLTTGDVNSWSWSFEGANQSSSNSQNPANIQYDTVGVYQVSLQVAINGLGEATEIKTAYIEVVEPAIADFEASDTVIAVNSTINFTNLSTGNIDSRLWTFEGSATPTTNLENPTGIEYEQTGCFEVKLEVSYKGLPGQTATKTCYIKVFDPNSISELNVEQISVYPNPASNFIRLTGLPGSLNVDYQLFNLQGQTVMEGQIRGEQAEIKVSALPNGSYYLRLSNASSDFVKQVVIAN